MLDRQQLETFAAVIEHQHFGSAATALNVTRGAVSQRIKALEESVGTPLVVRDGPVVPTPAGEAILRHIQAVRLLEEDTLQRIKPGDFERARVAIAVNADSLATWFEPVAWAVAQRHIALELIVDDQDHTLTLLARGEAMGCISTASDPPTGFVAEAIGAMRYDCVANIEFARTNFPDGLRLPNILAAPAVLFNRKDGLHDLFLESLLGFRVQRYPKHYFPSPLALLAAIRAGVGYGLVPSMQATRLSGSGEFTVLAAAHPVSVRLYWHHWESEPPVASAISRLVTEHAKKSLIQTA
jgi:LysR family transcriptional regulator, chromosome initiation inhibitor